jgi:3-deoxy-D-manno-octulosonic-acid transferase
LPWFQHEFNEFTKIDVKCISRGFEFWSHSRAFNIEKENEVSIVDDIGELADFSGKFN